MLNIIAQSLQGTEVVVLAACVVAVVGCVGILIGLMTPEPIPVTTKSRDQFCGPIPDDERGPLD